MQDSQKDHPLLKTVRRGWDAITLSPREGDSLTADTEPADAGRPEIPRSSVRARLLTFAFLGVVLWVGCFSGLNKSELNDSVDEGMYATAARWMVDTGNWLTLRGLSAEIVFDKGPLTYWCQAVSTRLLGATPVAVRLPSALAAALTALALWQWARRRISERAGLLAAALFALCPLTVGLARLAMTDSLMALWLTLTFIGLIEGYRTDRRGYLLAAAGAGLATLTKGVIGFLLPGAVMGLWLLLRRDFRELRRVPWLGATSLFLLLVLPWHLAMWWVHGNAFIQEYFVRRHLQRFLGQGYKFNFPFWFYLPVLLLGAFPFSVLVPVAWWRSFQHWRSERHELNCATAMWALVSLVVVALFSLSKSKLPQYAQPALPALSLLVAVRLDSSWRTQRNLSIIEAVCLGLTGVVLGELLVASGVLGWQWSTQPAPTLEESLTVFSFAIKKSAFLALLAPQLVILGSVVLIGTVIILSICKTTPRTACVMILMSMITAVTIAHFARSAWSDYYHSAPLNQLAEQTLPALERGEQLILYDLGSPTRYSLRFLLGHIDQITDTSEKELLLETEQEHRHGYIITSRNNELPRGAGNVQKESRAGKWLLWRFDADARSGESSVGDGQSR
ncbi:MAG: hypothetical protein DMF60_06815 [Acidobacteria bacterium]|nr:MAG: hypothetical protein DMF60_06815 [Acidobacteriota bacterium]